MFGVTKESIEYKRIIAVAYVWGSDISITFDGNSDDDIAEQSAR